MNEQQVDALDFPVRRRQRPSPRVKIYGDYVAKMVPGSKYYQDMRDRAAYVYITGQFPSHLRREYTGALVHLSHTYRKPASLDGRIGEVKLSDEVAADLALEAHAMVQEVRNRMREGFLIQGSRGFATRNGFHSIFMFRPASRGEPLKQITIRLDGAVKQGWGDAH